MFSPYSRIVRLACITCTLWKVVNASSVRLAAHAINRDDADLPTVPNPLSAQRQRGRTASNVRHAETVDPTP
ncbi:hypothetical protein C8Q73DRAFT_121907 [Cubamyces lactineus]|nr:hypothetical protein C8Q73DRAFT_121907 [Cubamyces lactineus]